MTKRRKIGLVLGTIVLGGGALCIAAFRHLPSSNDLLAKSIAIHQTFYWDNRYRSNPFEAGFRWKTSDSIVFFVQRADGNLQTVTQSFDKNGAVGEARMDGFFAPQKGQWLGLVSPDGRKMSLFLRVYQSSSKVSILDLSTGTITNSTRKPGGSAGCYWLADSKTLAGYDVMKQQYDTLSIESTVCKSRPLANRCASGDAMMITPRGESVVIKAIYPFIMPVTPSRCTVERTDAQNKVTKSTIVKPNSANGFPAFQISPDGKRILWQTTLMPPDSLWLKLRKKLRLGSNSAFLPASTTVWTVAEMDGSAAKTVCAFDTKEFSRAEPQWSPDGKKLAFVYKNQLYILPVD